MKKTIPLIRSSLVPLGLLVMSPFARAETGVTETEVLVGQSTGLTGSAAENVKLHSLGEKLYFRKINEAGGVNGRKIRVLTLDDSYDPQKTVANTERLIDQEKVFALFKYYGTPGIKASLPLIEKTGIPLIGPTSGAEFLYARSLPNVFLIRPSYFTETEQLVDYLVEKRGLKKLSMIYADDGYGTEGHNGVSKALARHDLKLTGAVVYRKTTTDFGPLYRELAAGKPDAIIVWTVVKPGIDFVNVAKRENFPGLLVGCSTIATPEFAKAAEGAVVPLAAPPASPDSPLPIVLQYLKDARATGQEPDSISFRGYFDALVLTEAIKRAGRELTRASLRDSFENKLRDADLGGIKLNFGAKSHKGLSLEFLTVVKNGKYELLAK